MRSKDIDEQLVRQMKADGYTNTCIANATRSNVSTILKYCKAKGISGVNLPYSQRPKYITPITPSGKYDHIWMEPICEGKDYEEYCEQYGIEIPEELEKATLEGGL